MISPSSASLARASRISPNVRARGESIVIGTRSGSRRPGMRIVTTAKYRYSCGMSRPNLLLVGTLVVCPASPRSVIRWPARTA